MGGSARRPGPHTPQRPATAAKPVRILATAGEICTHEMAPVSVAAPTTLTMRRLTGWSTQGSSNDEATAMTAGLCAPDSILFTPRGRDPMVASLRPWPSPTPSGPSFPAMAYLTRCCRVATGRHPMPCTTAPASQARRTLGRSPAMRNDANRVAAQAVWAAPVPRLNRMDISWISGLIRAVTEPAGSM